MTTPNSETIKSYQAILQYEESLYRNHGESLSPEETYLTEEELTDCLVGATSPADLLDDDMLLKFDAGYRSSHFDLLHRLSNIRNQHENDPLVFESDISIETEKVPDFGERDLHDLLCGAGVSNEKADLITYAVEGGDAEIDGLSSHQAAAIKKILDERNECLTLDGPTASGKSLTFSIPSFKHALDSLDQEGRTQTSSLLLYPRQALIRDQLSTLLPRLDRLNNRLEEAGDPPISVGVDHGDTPKDLSSDEEEESFFGITCPRCDQESDDNDLIIDAVTGVPQVRCPACEETFEYILPTKRSIAEEPPTILLSTVWSVYHRLRSSRGDNATRYDDLEYIVLDEAHIYTNYVGGHVQYILQLLKEAGSEGEIPQFVLSSATLSNPVEFAKNLTTLDRGKVAHVDYSEVLEAAGVEDERHLVHYYVLPPPNRSVETLNEAMVQCLNLWCTKRNYRALNFIDSIAEINRQYSYIAKYILSPSGNRGEEVIRHTHSEYDQDDPFSWEPLLPTEWEESNRGEFQDYTMNAFADSIGTHTSELHDLERNQIEDSFNAADGGKRLLLSTSTLEMGVDLNSVAAVLQYKLPPGKNEGVIQRIGRAGRNPDTYRVGLGIIEFSSSPSSMMYMFDEELRQELENVSNLSPSQIGNSASIQVQHVLSRALHRMAREGHETYADGIDGLQSKDELIEFLKQLVDYVEATELPASFVDPESTRRETFERQREEFLAQLRTIISGYETTEDASDIDPERILTKSQRYYDELRQVRRKLESVRRDLEALPELPDEYMEPIKGTAESLRTITHLVNDLEETVRHAWYTRDPGQLQQWVAENEEDLREAIEQVPERSEMHDLLFMDLMVWVSGEYGSTAELEEKYNLHMDQITENLTNSVQRFEPKREDNFKSEIESLLDEVKELQRQNLEVLAATHVLSRFEELVSEYQRARGAHLFPVLNTILQNSIHFTGTFEAPQPEFEMEGDTV
ncbi:DEAD/DEAH box helicase [Natronobacterium texcoconense]|uniref:DEAD/DEAH box helicase n=1 Tax=Natronobacterium texcoconense TaxID=1095778 RepID=A0A1H1FY07_NATTX|nr:DEAD/DEAH box helicase [Natronobacterium texcoconense]SDR05857.1 DEAD/DEAH box helicase [Natronobacterium texcoconense]